MATAIITEYNRVAFNQGGGDKNGLPIPQEPANTDQSVSYDAAASSSAFAANTNFIRIICDADANVLFGASGVTATATNQRLEANVEYFRAVRAGDVVSIYDGTT